MFTNYRLLLLLGVFTLLASCKAGEHYLDKRYKPQLVTRSDADTLSQCMRWEQLYQDTILNRLIRTALIKNNDIHIATATIKEFAATYRVEQSQSYPQINAKIEYETKKGGSTSGSGEAYGTLSWEVDLWGKIRWSKMAAFNSYLRTIEARKAVEMVVVSGVAQTYFELRALDKELHIVRQTLQARQQGIDIALLRYRGGLTSEIAYKQAQVEYARTATLVPQLEQTIQTKENALALLLGQQPDSVRRHWQTSERLLQLQIPEQLSSQLICRRPDILIAEQSLKTAQAKAGIAYASLFPSFTLTGNYGLESNALQSFLRSPHWAIGGAVVAPLLQMGKNRSKLKAAEAVYEQEIYRYQKSVLIALQEVSNAITAANKTIEIVKLRTNLEHQASAYLKSAELQYMNGVISYLDVLDAQRGYLDAQIALNNALRDRELTMVTLYKSLGGGWQ